MSWQSSSVLLTSLLVVVFIDQYILKPPRKLRHIPSISFIRYIKAVMIERRSREEIGELINLQALKQSPNGLFVGYDEYGWGVHVSMPNHMRQVLTQQDHFPKADVINMRKGSLFGRIGFGPNIFMVNGNQWKLQRRITNPAFHRSLPINLCGRVSEDLFNLVMGQGGVFNIHSLTEQFTLDVLGQGIFGVDFCAIQDGDNYWHNTYVHIMKAATDPFFFLFPVLDKQLRFLFPSRVRDHQLVTNFFSQIQLLADEKRATLDKQQQDDMISDHEKDLLTLLVEGEKEQEIRLTNEEMLNNLIAFFIAGHDNISNAIARSVYYMATHPQVQAKARRQVIRILGDDHPQKDIRPMASQLQEMDYLDAVINETLRMSMSVTNAVPRVAAQDSYIDGVFIPKGTTIAINLYEAHHNPRVWNNPYSFKPERFEPGGEYEKLKAQGDGTAFIAFGIGPRLCVGQNLAMAEMRVFLAMLLRRYEWTLPKNSIHKDAIVVQGMAFCTPVKLDLEFTSRYQKAT
ncbi:cytochrome P450 [Lichtheimia hyalospora FSU 10163]|nr:cytochrome P450 [Lichtheimia hyalospora FSU 10163]